MLRFSKEIADGMRHLHANNFVHRDLKSQNILIQGNERTLKICDFGSALQSHELQSIQDTTELVSRFYRGECFLSIFIFATSYTTNITYFLFSSQNLTIYFIFM
jgi:serine/threonine protein kinase